MPAAVGDDVRRIRLDYNQTLADIETVEKAGFFESAGSASILTAFAFRHGPFKLAADI
jgi:hypothetical protein